MVCLSPPQQALDYFDYAGKLDNDVSFVKPFPEPNLPKRMQQGGRKMLVTQKQWYYDDPHSHRRRTLSGQVYGGRVERCSEVTGDKVELRGGTTRPDLLGIKF